MSRARYYPLRDACMEAVAFEADEFGRGSDCREDLDQVTLEWFVEWRQTAITALFGHPRQRPAYLAKLKTERDRMESYLDHHPVERADPERAAALQRAVNRIALLERIIEADRRA